MEYDSANPRETRGREIARRYTIKQEDGIWLVPSSSGKSTRYKVDLKKLSCTCPDFEFHRQKCKHIFAVEFSFEQEFLALLTEEEMSQIPKSTQKRKTYPQFWSPYNKSQVFEKFEFQNLLAELCKGIAEPSHKNGRPPLNLGDMIFACVFKVYSTYSSRRFMTDLRTAHAIGFISELPHYNAIFRYLQRESLTPYLKIMIEQSSLPLVALEKAFAVDASGFATTGGFTWLYARYTEPRLIEKRDWLKMHICIGTLTNIITAAEVTEKYDHEANYFAPLVEATAKNFEMVEISADAAYLSKANLQIAVDNDIYPYIAWKSNSRETDKVGNELWNRLYHYYAMNKDKFLTHYHRRSNVETAFHMLKTLFGENLRSKMRTAQINECLARILAHNLICLVRSMYKFGLKPEFWREI
ncbi:MAG TPA: transposase [Pyrinomonadaceae bacterium]|nr:transposase [Pyrinomonadaceae bacterium]